MPCLLTSPVECPPVQDKREVKLSGPGLREPVLGPGISAHFSKEPSSPVGFPSSLLEKSRQVFSVVSVG